MTALIFGGRGKNWGLLVGSDENNADAGFTLLYGRRPSDGPQPAWRHVCRLNIRWPLQFKRRRYR